MSENRGKKFEKQVEADFELIPNVSVDRIHDQTNGYLGSSNICDFIVYKKPYEYYIECKSHYGNTFPFSCLTEKQYSGMLEKSTIYGVKCYVIIWYIDRDVTLAVPIQEIEKAKKIGNKSWRFDDTKNAIVIPAKKKRVFFEYDFTVLFKET